MQKAILAIIGKDFCSFEKLCQLINSLSCRLVVYTNSYPSKLYEESSLQIVSLEQLFIDKPSRLAVFSDKNSTIELEPLARRYLEATESSRLVQVDIDSEASLSAIASFSVSKSLKLKHSSEQFSDTSLQIASQSFSIYTKHPCFLLSKETTVEDLHYLTELSESFDKSIDILVDNSGIAPEIASTFELAKLNPQKFRLFYYKSEKELLKSARLYSVGIYLNSRLSNKDLVTSQFCKMILAGLIVFTPIAFTRLPSMFNDLSGIFDYLKNLTPSRAIEDRLMFAKIFLTAPAISIKEALDVC